MIRAFIGLLLPVAAVWLWLQALRLRTAADSRAVTAAVAFCAGLGLSSLIAFWWAVLAGGIGPRFPVADVLLWTAIAAGGWLRLRRIDLAASTRRPVDEVPRLSRSHWLVRIGFALLLGIAIAAAVIEYLALPYGQTDATLIWNLKARFMVRGGEAWTDFMDVSRANPSHPLLVSASVARLWAYAGAESTIVPATLGLATGAAVLAVLIGALDVRRTRAWIAGCVLIAPWTFSRSTVAQTADLTFGVYLLVTLIVLLRCGHPRAAHDARELALAGLLTGLMAWTKNEGLFFLAIALPLAAWAVPRARRVRALGWFMVGAVPALAAVAWLKLVLAPVAPEYFAGAEAGWSLQALGDPARYQVLLGLIWQHALAWGGPAAAGSLPLLALGAGAVGWSKAGRLARPTLVVLVLMLAAYCAAWLASPLDPAWLVGETFDRLLVQLWPSLVFAAFSFGQAPASDVDLRGAIG